MGGTEPGSAREEAERLVASLLATARVATGGAAAGPWGPLGGIVSGVLGHNPPPGRAAGSTGTTTGGTGTTGAGFATGTPECCVCPVCRAMVALRDPSPEFTERLATGAGDLAAGVASLLRAFAPQPPTPGAPQPPTPGAPGSPTAGSPTGGAPTPPTGSRPVDDDQVWREATRTGHDSQPVPEPDVWSAATRAADVAPPSTGAPPVDVAGPDAAAPPAAPPVPRTPDSAGGDASGDGA